MRPLPGNPGDAAWACPFCTEGEAYTRITNRELLAYQTFAYAAAVQNFGRPADARLPVRLISGLLPECVRTPPPRGYDLYLSYDADPLQQRLQLGHEMFHRVCSQGQIFHWTHEMMACVFSVLLLRDGGHADYADQMDTTYRAQAERLPLDSLLTADVAVPPYPPGLYGRAYVTGITLIEAEGWDALCRRVAVDARGHTTLPSFLEPRLLSRLHGT